MEVNQNLKRILYIHGGILARGGTEAYMMNYYRHFDREKLQIDFVVHGDEKGVYDDEIEAMGGRIYRVPVKSKDIKGNITALRRIFLSGEYQLIHAHMDTMNFMILRLARECGIPVRISHSHNTAVQTNNPIKRWLNNIMKKGIHREATHLFACSELAGQWLYGKSEYRIIPNAVNFDKFSFHQECRDAIRERLGLSTDDFVIGHVGRFSEQKNHVFFIKLIKELVETDKRFKLVLIGDGTLKNRIRSQVLENKLEDYVRFVDSCPDVNEYYNSFDYFCLPSLFEGLPVVGIEAQVNGLHCIVSDTISRTLDMTGNVIFLPIGAQNSKVWCDYLLEHREHKRDPESCRKMREAGYDIDHTADALQKTYLDLIKDCQ